MKDPIAIVCSDLHLTLKQPACRNDKDWMATQQHYLEQLTELSFVMAQKSEDMRGKYLPVIIAGDIFDKWNPSPELLSFAFRHLPPRIWAVPGQHDLPNHRRDDMHKSGYGVLVEAERINDLGQMIDHPYSRYSLHGFPWGKEIEPPDKSFAAQLMKVAVLHRFVWTKDTGYPGAPEDHDLFNTVKQLKGYDVAIFGDNHKGFLADSIKPVVFNCGGFIRRKTDEMNYKPHVGILHTGHTKIKRHYLDTSIDRFHSDGRAREQEAEEFDMREFLENLDGLGEGGSDFKEAVRQALRENHVPKGVEALILRALDS